MNYIKQLNVFYDWLQCNRLSASAQLLYHTLLMINNRAGWADWFQRTNQAICGLIGIDEKTLIKARNELKQKGLIDFTAGKKKGDITKYRLIDLSNYNGDYAGNFPPYPPVEPPAYPPVERPVEPPVENACTISKINASTEAKLKHKHKQKNINIVTSNEVTADAQEGAPNNKNIIAELVEHYRKPLPKEKHSQGDYPFIGKLYNEFGYDVVLEAINEMEYSISTGFLPEKPLIYLKHIIQKKLSLPKVSESIKEGVVNGNSLSTNHIANRFYRRGLD